MEINKVMELNKSDREAEIRPFKMPREIPQDTNLTGSFSDLLVDKCLARKEYEKPKNKGVLGLSEVELLYSKGLLDEIHTSKLLSSNKNHLKTLSEIEEEGYRKILDTVKVVEIKEKYVELKAFNTKKTKVKLSNEVFEKHKELLLEEGIYGIVTLESNLDDKAEIFISDIEPIEGLSASEKSEILIRERERLTTEEWLNLIIKSVGFSPEKLLFWEKIFMIIRLIPLCEANYNLLELGPKEIGKTTMYEYLGPSTKILNGRATYAQTFYNVNTKEYGHIKNHEVLIFDEIDKVKFQDSEVVNSFIQYMNNGSFHGAGQSRAATSIVFSGNIFKGQGKIESGKYDIMKELKSQVNDDAIFTRFHFFIPGWGVRKIERENLIGEGDQALRVDVLKDFLINLRSENYYFEIINETFSLKDVKGKNISEREFRSIERTVSGLLKILHPHKEATEEEVLSYYDIAFKGRELLLRALSEKNSDEFEEKEYQVWKKENPIETKSSFEKFIKKVEGRGNVETLFIPNRLVEFYPSMTIKYALDAVGIEKNKKELDGISNLFRKEAENSKIICGSPANEYINSQYFTSYRALRAMCFIDYDNLFKENMFGGEFNFPEIMLYNTQTGSLLLDCSILYPYKNLEANTQSIQQISSSNAGIITPHSVEPIREIPTTNITPTQVPGMPSYQLQNSQHNSLPRRVSDYSWIPTSEPQVDTGPNIPGSEMKCDHDKFKYNFDYDFNSRSYYCLTCGKKLASYEIKEKLRKEGKI